MYGDDKYAKFQTRPSLVNRLAMQRYGYFFKSEIQKESSTFLGKEFKIDYMHASYFKNLKDCIRNALYYNALDTSRSDPSYLKILNNTEVVNYIHNSNKNCFFGFMHLCFEDVVSEPMNLFSTCDTLYKDMLDCVCASKCGEELNITTDFVIKVGYFVMLTPDDIVRELHCTCM